MPEVPSERARLRRPSVRHRPRALARRRLVRGRGRADGSFRRRRRVPRGGRCAARGGRARRRRGAFPGGSIRRSTASPEWRCSAESACCCTTRRAGSVLMRRDRRCATARDRRRGVTSCGAAFAGRSRSADRPRLREGHAARGARAGRRRGRLPGDRGGRVSADEAVVGGKRAVLEASGRVERREVLVARGADATRVFATCSGRPAARACRVRRGRSRELDVLARDHRGVVARIAAGTSAASLTERDLAALARGPTTRSSSSSTVWRTHRTSGRPLGRRRPPARRCS